MLLEARVSFNSEMARPLMFLLFQQKVLKSLHKHVLFMDCLGNVTQNINNYNHILQLGVKGDNFQKGE